VDDASEESSSSDESDTEQQGKALNVSATMHQASRKVLTDEELGVNILIKRKNVYDFFCHGRKDRDRVFPVVIRRRRLDDDYGEPIRHEDYIRTDQGFDKEQQDTNGGGGDDGQDGSKLGTKKKWADDRTGGAGGWRNRGHDAAEEPDLLQSLSGFVPDGELDGVEEADGAPDDASQGPCKLVTTTETVACSLRLGFVDFGGIHDRRSLHMLIPLIQPRKLILVAGEADETTALAEDCRALLSVNVDGEEVSAASAVSVYAPAVGERVDASVDTNAWVVKLSEPLVRTLQWQTVKGLSVATISGQVLREMVAAASSSSSLAPPGDESAANKRQKTEEPDETAVSTAIVTSVASRHSSTAAPLPILDLVATPAAATSGGAARGLHRPLHVGDVRLTELRKGLQSRGHSAEFKAEGTLVVDGCVVVRKGTAGRIEIETWGAPTNAAVGGARGRVGAGGGATAGNTFFEIRRMVYDALAVVGA
jgi:cleavage and polyadenylation specificity factor subunit 2